MIELPRVMSGHLGAWWTTQPREVLLNATRLRDLRERAVRNLLEGRMRFDGTFVELAFGLRRSERAPFVSVPCGGTPPDFYAHFVAADYPIPHSLPGMAVQTRHGLILAAVVPEAGRPIPHRIAALTELCEIHEALAGRHVSIRFCAESEVRTLRREVDKCL